MFSRRIQQRVRQFVTLIMRPLAQLGVTPNTMTLLGLVLSAVTAIVIANGYFLVGGLLVLFAGIFDMFDGALARARNASSTFGTFLDSTLDRYSESIILFGLFWYVLQAGTLHENLWPFQHEQSWMLSSIYIAVVGSLMVSYAKARAEGLGLECKTGLLARPERVVILAIGLLTGTTIWALTLLAVLSHVTAVERIVHVWRAANQSLESKASFPGELQESRSSGAPARSTEASGQISASGLASETDGTMSDRLASIETDELRDTSVKTVS